MEKDIYLAGGCFWGMEHYLKQIEGVSFTEVGFANGFTANPSYKEVYTDATGYAECVHVCYDTKLLNLSRLLELFFDAIDPVSVNRQGEDEGTRYRTGIYYVDEEDIAVIGSVYDEVEIRIGKPLAVELLPLNNFYPAEEYHQDYLDKHPDGYCHLPKALFELARTANKVRR